MKKLNLNNTIATTAMLTKTNTMKNKMNLFAKVVMLVAMIGMLLPNVAWGQAIDKKQWEKSNNTWYILNVSDVPISYYFIVNINEDQTYTIYMPNVDAPGIFDIKCDRSAIKRFTAELKEEGTSRVTLQTQSQNYTVSSNNVTLTTHSQQINITATVTEHNSNTSNKYCKVSIKVPVHCDVATTLLDFGSDVQINGNKPLSIDLRSFLTETNSGLIIKTSNSNVFKIGNSSNTNSQETLCSGSNEAYSPYTPNSKVTANKDFLDIYFTPTAFGTFNETIYIYDGTTLRCSIPVTGTCNPIYTWTPNTTLAQSEVVNNAASISGYMGTIYYESSDRDVIDLLDNNNQIVPEGSKGTKIVSRNAGASTITASIDGSTVTSQCEFTVTNLGVQVIEWNQDRDLLRLKMGTTVSPMTLTAVAKDKSTLADITGSSISYSSDNTNVVSVSGNQLTLVGPGEATLTATALAIEGQYVAATTTRQVKVKAAGDNSCTEFAISGVTVNGNSTKTLSFNGIYPDKLSFTAEWGAWATGTSSIYAVDGNGNHIGDALYTVTYTGRSWTDGSESKSNIQVPINAAGLKFEGDIQGGRLYRSVTVTQASFMDALRESYDFGNGAINVSNTHDITAALYSNLNDEITATITGTNADQFKLNTSGYGEGCGKQGNAVFSVTFKPTSVGQKTATLHLSAQIGNNPVSCDITLTGNGTKLSQTITWNPQSELADGQLFSLTTKPDNANQTAPITLNAHTTAKHGDDELPITYTSNNTDIAYVTGNQLYINKAGTVKITASQAGDATYEPAQNSPSYTLNISKVTPNLSVIGNQTPEVFSTFQVSASSTGTTSEGYNGASDGKIQFTIDQDANTHATISNYSEANKSCDVTVSSRETETGVPVKVVAHLAATDIYKARTETLTVNATKATPIINWPESSTELSGTRKVGDEVQLNAKIQQNSNYKVTYVSSNTTLATVDNNTGKMTCVAPGIVKITATFTGNVDLIASAANEKISYLFLISPADFGEVQILSNETIPFLISTGESGTFDISSTDMAGFFVSNDNTTGWSNSGLTGITDGSTIYFKFQPNAATGFSKSFRVTHNSKKYSGNLTGTGSERLVEFGNLGVTEGTNNDWFLLPSNFFKSSTDTYSLTLNDGNTDTNDDKSFMVQIENGSFSSGATGVACTTQYRIGFYPKNYKSSYSTTLTITDSEFGIAYPVTVSGTSHEKTYSEFPATRVGQATADGEDLVINMSYFDCSNDLTVTAPQHFLLRGLKSSEPEVYSDSWSKTLNVGSRAKFKVRFAPESPVAASTDSYIVIHDNTEAEDAENYKYKLTINESSVEDYTYTFSEDISVMGITNTPLKHELSNFIPTGDITVDAWGDGGNNFMVSKTAGGTYTPLITLEQSDVKEFYIKFAPLSGGEKTENIVITDVATGRVYKVKASGTTAESNFGNVNIGQASDEMTFSLQTLSSQGATSFTITPSNPYIFRVFTDDESTYSSATAQGAINLTSSNSFNVKFYPELVGEDTGNITVKTDNNLTINIAVKGTGVRQSLNFGNVTLGNTSATSMQIDLTNMVSANGYTVTSNKPGIFRINEQTESVEIAGDGSFNVRFYPSSALNYNNNNEYYVTIHDKRTNKDYKIYASGTGAARQTIGFGNIPVTEGSSETNVAVNGYPVEGFKIYTSDYQEFWINGSPVQNGVDITSSAATCNISFHPQTTGNKNARIYVTDGTYQYDVVNVSGSGTQKALTLNWVDNDKLNVGDVESHLATTGSGTDDYITVTYTSSDNSILYVDNDNPSQVIAVGAGTATLTATIDASKGQNGNFTFTNSSEFPISKEFTVTEDRILVIVPGTNIKRLGNLKTNADSINLDAVVQFKDGTPYTAQPAPNYSLPSNDGCVTLNGCTLTVNHAGLATLQMSVDDDPTNQIIGNTLTYNIVVTEIGDCSHTELDINGFSFTSQSIEGLVRTLTVQKKNGELPPMRKLAFHWVVEGYAPKYTFDVKENDQNGNTLMDQISGDYSIFSGNKKDEGNVEINLTNHQLENICFEFHSTFIGEWSVSTASITDVHVYQQSYFRKAENEPSSLTFRPTEYGKSVQLPLNFDYSAISPLTFEIVSGDNYFSISDSDLGIADCSDFGQKTVNVVFTPNKVGQCSATIRIKAHTIDRDIWFDYTVSGEGLQRQQIINNWNQDVITNMLDRFSVITIGDDPGDRYPPATPTYNVSGKSIEYISDRPDVIEIGKTADGTKWRIIVKNTGTAYITAHIDGDTITTEGNSVRKFTVQKSNQQIHWDDWETSGKTIKTNCSENERDILLDATTKDEAGKDIPKDEIKFHYTIVSTTLCDNTQTELAEIVTKNNKQYLRYKGNGKGSVVLTVSADENNNYNAALNNNNLQRTLTIDRTSSSEYSIGTISRTPSDLKYGDLTTLNTSVTFNPTPFYDLNEKIDYEYSTGSYSTIAEVFSYNQLKIKSASSFDLTYTVKNNCWMSDKNTSINLTANKTDQVIVYHDIPTQYTYNTGPTKTINLNTYFYSVDKRHSEGAGYDGIATYLNKTDGKVLTGLDLTYTVTFVADDPNCPAIATFDNDHTITITGQAAGTVKISAIQTGSSNYNNASIDEKSFRIEKITPTNVTVNPPSNPVVFGGGPYTLTANSTGENYSSSDDFDAKYTYDITEGKGSFATISDDQLTVLKAGTIKVVASQVANCMVNSSQQSASIEYEITIEKATPNLTVYPNNITLTYPQDLKDGVEVTLTTENGDPDMGWDLDIYESVANLVSVEYLGNSIFNVKPQANVGNGTITFICKETDNYHSNSIELNFSVQWGDLELELNEGVLPALTSVSIINLSEEVPGFATTNYEEGVTYSYSLVSIDDGGAEASIDENNILTIKSIGKIQLQIKARNEDAEKEDVKTTSVLTVGIGILEFSPQGDSDNKWTTPKNWAPHRDRIPDATNFDVLIADSCFIGKSSATVENENDFLSHTVNAACYDLSFTNEENAKLVIGEASTLKVAGNLTNDDDPSKLVLTANYWGQASVVFGNDGSAEHPNPMATIEMYIPEGNGSKTDPKWQYRGICVDNFSPITVVPVVDAEGNPIAGETINPWSYVYVFEWDEKENADLNHGCWVNGMKGLDITNGSLQPWKGYCFANMTQAPSSELWLTYTGTLIKEDKNIDLSYNYHEYETGKPFANVGSNLITNSYAAPLLISELSYSDVDCEKGVVLYNAGSHAQWEQGGNAYNQRGQEGQFSTIPLNTGEPATGITTIPAGQSFFVQAIGNGATLTLPYSTAISISPSTRMYLPGKEMIEPEYNMLKIRVTAKSDSTQDYVALLECETCTRQYDNGYDGKKRFGDNGLPQIYAYNKFGNTAVNADSTLNKQYVGFMAGSDDETYTISFETDKLFGYHSLYLTDRKLNETVDILAGETYQFKGYTVGENMRFQINGITEQEWNNENDDDDDNDNDDSNVCDLRIVGNTLYVQGFTTDHYPAARVELFDMTGNLVWSTPLTSERLYDLPQLPQGIYMVRLGDCHVKYSSMK